MKIVLTIVLILMQTAAIAAPACCSTNLAPAAPLSDRSIYNVESVWTSDLGKEVPLRQLNGRVQIVTMFFSSCVYACPIIVHDLKKIEAGLKAAGVTNPSFVLVTFDTENDTIEKLHSFRRQRELNDHWMLLRGSPDDVAELGALLGVKYRKEANGQFAHSNIITVLNAKGEIVHQQLGLNSDPGPTIAAVLKVQASP